MLADSIPSPARPGQGKTKKTRWPQPALQHGLAGAWPWWPLSRPAGKRWVGLPVRGQARKKPWQAAALIIELMGARRQSLSCLEGGSDGQRG